jgi:hypothetical protein
MNGRASRLAPKELAPLPRARIAMSRPAFLNGAFLFELIAVDGPRRGQCVASIEVTSIPGPSGGRLSSPTLLEATNARQSLRAIGEQGGYAVADY